MSAIEHLLKPHVRDLGDFTVRRLLPAAATQTVGPFIFFDHMGPVQLPPAPALTCARIHISGWPRSPTCSRARSSTATAWAATRRSARATSTG